MEIKKDSIIMSDAAIAAIGSLQHNAGTYEYYRSNLDRLFSYILHCSDEIGMSDIESIETLRAIDGIRRDLAAIAGPVACGKCPKDSTEEEIAGRVEESFTDVDDIHDSDIRGDAMDENQE